MARETDYQNSLRPNYRQSARKSPRRTAVMDRDIPRKTKASARSSHDIPVWSMGSRRR